MEKIYTIKCIGGFRDGMVYPRYIKNGEVLTDVDERLWHKLKQSDPDAFEVVQTVQRIPPPTKASDDKS